MAKTTFDSTAEVLEDLLEQAGTGKLQLPEFQRDWVWDDYGIRSLLASLSQAFPVGAVMMLQTGGEVDFRPRPIAGAGGSTSLQEPERLVLDGQQRLTSLFQACYTNTPVTTLSDKRRRIRRWYYIDMNKALDSGADREEAIIGVPEERIIRKQFGREVALDLSTPEKEYEQHMFPANRLFAPDEWEDGYQAFWDYDSEANKFYRDFRREVIDAFRRYQVPVISLRRETTKEAVCLVFEKVNTGGKKLDAFELLTAIYAADDFNLRHDWLGDTNQGIEGRSVRLARYTVLQELASTDFLQAIALLHTSERREEARAQGITNPKELPAVSCTRRTILNLPLSAYKSYADTVETAFTRAAQFLWLQKVYWHKDVPYPTQLVPLAAVIAKLGNRWEDHTVREHLARWYWCGVFGELYGSTTETRFANDFVEIPEWINGGQEPSTVREAVFAPDRLHGLRSRIAAAYKGVNALLKKRGCRDLRSGQPLEYNTFWEEGVDIHHIFPQAWCKKQGLTRTTFDSILNKTPLSQRTNRIIGSRAPSDYLQRIQEEAGVPEDTLDEWLRSHAMDPESLRANDFQAFIDRRSDTLLGWIAEAMGKEILREGVQSEGEDPGEDAEEVFDSVEDVGPKNGD